MVKLSSAHIIIGSTLAETLFGNAQRVNWVYYPQRKTLMVAGAEDELFKQLHKTSGSMLKLRNEQGDRGIAIRELLIDNDLDEHDRELEYKADTGLNILNIYF